MLCKLALALFLLLVLFTATITGGGYYLWQKPNAVTTETILVIPPGGVMGVANILKDAKLIPHAKLYAGLTRLTGDSRNLKAGEYAFPPHSTMRDITAILREGKTIQHFVTFAEGLTVYEIVEILRNTPLLTGDITSLPPEGQLLPETYAFHRNDSRQSILNRMQAAQQTALESLWANRPSGLPLATPDEALTLASIIEKETGKPEERRMVAGVYTNRLRMGMRLQADPTVLYGITGGKARRDRGLTRAELDTDTPYNSYIRSGLPPTPIACPGLESLKAALNPAAHDFVYFVADGTGGHAFAQTLAEHNRNVAAWRKKERGR